MALGLLRVANSVFNPFKHFATKLGMATTAGVGYAGDQIANEGKMTNALLGSGGEVADASGDALEAGKSIIAGDFAAAQESVISAGQNLVDAKNVIVTGAEGTSANIDRRREQAETLSEISDEVKNGDVGSLFNRITDGAQNMDVGGFLQKAAPWLMGVFAFFTGGDGLGGGASAALTVAVTSIALPMMLNAFGGNENESTLARDDRNNSTNSGFDANAVINGIASPEPGV